MKLIHHFLSNNKLGKLWAAFSSSCGMLQRPAITVGPLGPNNSALRAHLKLFKIRLEIFAEIHLENLAEICFNFFCGNPFEKV